MTTLMPSATEPVETLEYYRHLDAFTALCDRLVAHGFAYLAVVLSHELYRFLYPTEPYASYVADRPVDFVTRRLQRLIEHGERFTETVVAYRFDSEAFASDELNASTLERSTSNLYAGLWRPLDEVTLTRESLELLRRRIPGDTIASHIERKDVLDMGCGSGRYSIALAACGARSVVGVDWQAAAYGAAKEWCARHQVPARFVESDVLLLPFGDASFDFVFCNGVLHHSRSISDGLGELRRVLKPSGAAFLYLYGAGGIFWNTRVAMRGVFQNIPLAFTKQVLRLIGMPSNRFIFCDTWYVPRETHTTQTALHEMLDTAGFRYRKLIGQGDYDLDRAIDAGIAGARAMWGDGEHRYILEAR